MPMITRSTLEVVIPEYAVPKLITKSRNKLAQISEVSPSPNFSFLRNGSIWVMFYL